MVRLTIAACLALGLGGLGGCAGSDTVTRAPVEAGASRDFAAPYDAVKKAAMVTVGRLGLNLEGESETPARYQISFSKSLNAFSWGEVGAINVTRVGERQTRVYVRTRKRSMMQITGTSQSGFAAEIFSGIAAALPPS